MDPVTFFAQENSILQQDLGFVTLVSIAALVAILIRRIRLPYTVALVVVGLILSFFPNFLNFTLSSDLILAILVPPLLFEATLHIRWEHLRNELGAVLLLAVGGTLLGTFLVGGIVMQALKLPLLAALAFGALISATDPVAVIAFFRSLGVSKRLALLVEGESLFNDGTSIVLFNLALGAALAANENFTWQTGVIEFFRVSLGGLAVGAVLGYAVSYLILKNVDDHLIETATTVALAFGAFVAAEEFHLSGILAVVTAGLMVGNIGSQNTSPTTQITLENFWEFMGFVVNSLVFLLLGLEVEISRLIANLTPSVVAIVAVLLSRVIIVYGFSWIYGRFLSPTRRIPMKFQHVMYWGGLRGAISLALALTLTGRVFGPAIAQELRLMTFGVVLFTLLVQGITIERLIQRLGLAAKPETEVEQQRRQAILYARQAGQRELSRLYRDGILFPDIWEAMATVYDEQIDQSKLALRDHLLKYPELEQEMYLQARERALRAERQAISDAARRGVISDDLHHQLIREADNHLAALELLQTRRIQSGKEEEGSE
ncbi:MAG: Na+/H+ antiporter [Chloroflexi bacterium]|nr:MAG: Na+/H+ antiporter [Chloroflexota bacterium]